MASRETIRGFAAIPRRVYILATSEHGAAVALETVRQLAAGKDVEFVVLVPHVVPYGVDLARCGHDLTRLGEPYCAVAIASGVSATIRVCACREVRHHFGLLLVDRAHVLIAGRRGRWWRSRDERHARALESAGHHVQFVDIAAREQAVHTLDTRGRPPLRLVRPSARRTNLRDDDQPSRDFGRRPAWAAAEKASNE